MYRTFVTPFAFVVLAFIACAPDVTAEITKGPYLQWPGKTGMTIMWEADAGGEAVVHYGEKKPDKKLEVKPARPVTHTRNYQDDKEVTSHWYATRLEKLKPGTTYKYYVAIGKTKSKEAAFRTSPEKGEKFTFIAYGDSRGSGGEHGELAAMFPGHSPSFILHTGDFVNTGEVYFQWQDMFFDPLKNIISRVPLWPSRGNHDGMDADFAQFFALPSKKFYYSFDYANAHFVCLDSYGGEKMLEWCKKDLAASKADWKIVFFHVPMYNAGGHGVSTWRSNFLPAFHKHGVDLVFAGHSHIYERFHPLRPAKLKKTKPITHIVTGGGGAPLYEALDHPTLAASARTYHYLAITIDGKKLSARATDLYGKVIDKFSFSRAGAAYNKEYMKLTKDDPDALRERGM